jgi:hypothetical protein
MAEGGRGEVLVQQQQYGRLRGVKVRMRDDGSAWFARCRVRCPGARRRSKGDDLLLSVTINDAAATFDDGGRWVVLLQE